MATEAVDRAIEVRFAEAASAAKTLSSKDRKTLERLLRQLLAERNRED